MKRTGKFYRKNEAEVMKALGLKPTKNSGSGWIEKEDGQNENIICQLKSTDAQSIKINKLDLDKLNYNAGVCNKIPVFAIQFLQSNEVYVLFKPEDLPEVNEYLNTGKFEGYKASDFINLGKELAKGLEEGINNNIIKSSSKAKDRFRKELENKYKKERKSAK